VPVVLADRDRDGAHPLGGEAGQTLAGPQVNAPDRLLREADVAAHREPETVLALLAHVDARDVRPGDLRDIGAHRGQHLFERAVLVAERDQPEDPVQGAVAALVNLEAQGPALRRAHV